MSEPNTNNDAAAEARKGLMDAVAGKAKEVAGAITGKDALAEEGQLQQASAAARKDANSREAIAQTTLEQTTAELHEVKDEVVEDKHRAYAEAGRREDQVEQTADAEKRNAEAQARVTAAAGQALAEQQAAKVARDGTAEAADLQTEAAVVEHRATQEQRRLESQARLEEQQAAQLRAEATSDEKS
jgi:uncharacterized protein YjbJ (UPF0337 family)